MYCRHKVHLDTQAQDHWTSFPLGIEIYLFKLISDLHCNLWWVTLKGLHTLCIVKMDVFSDWLCMCLETEYL